MRKFFKIIFILILISTSISCCRPKDYSGNLSNDPKIIDDYSTLVNISNYKKWGTYNVHDPSCIKAGEYYYLYSTDAIYFPKGATTKSDTIHIGNIQVRRSKDLVHWEFFGWAFDSIPDEALKHVKEASGGQVPNGIWAPYIMKASDEYRLYFSVSAFGANTSYIGMATGKSPEGPWKQKGCVVKTFKSDAMNAIDPTVAVNSINGEQWMIYGSFFGGIYCVQLNPETGLTLVPGDKGKCIARRADGAKKIIEAPEVIYNPVLKKYFLFVSYDPLFTHYNVRVGRADKPEGPYLDFFGKNMAAPENNYPVLTYAYRFQNHPGWSGVGHCGVINDNGKFYMFHQGRLAPDNLMMVLHVRRIFWNSDGWPVVSPERYAGLPQIKIKKKDLIGKWEKIDLNEIANSVELWQGQIPKGGWKYDTSMFNNYKKIALNSNGEIEGMAGCKWDYQNDKLQIIENKTDTIYAILSGEWDWERKQSTIVFTGLNLKGISIWGKKLD